MPENLNQTGAIFDIKRFAIHDGPGIRTTVFLKGCPMDCWWCHNPEARDDITGPLAEKTKYMTVGEIIDEVERDRVFYDQSGGGVTFSGGEPMAQPEFLRALLESCRSRGLSTAVDTCGYAPREDFQTIRNLVDLFLFDLKLMDDKAHSKYTSVSNSLVLENLTMLAKNGSRVNLRIPLVPGITDTDANLNAMLDFLSGLPDILNVSLLPYNRFGEDKRNRFKLTNRLGKLPAQSRSDLDRAAQLFKSRGYDVKVGG